MGKVPKLNWTSAVTEYIKNIFVFIIIMSVDIRKILWLVNGIALLMILLTV